MEKETTDQMRTGRKIFLRASGTAFGFAMAILLVIGLWFWQQDRQEQWDVDSIVASFDSVDTEGKDQSLLFFYTIENRTNRDYRIESGDDVMIAARLKDQGSLSPDNSGEFLSVEYPLFIPAHEKVFYRIHVGGYYDSDKVLPPDTDRVARRSAVAAYVNEKFKNLNGFVLLDQAQHRKIVFPRGW